MRNRTIAGIAITLLCGSAEGHTDSSYRTVQEICLFSSFLPAAESPFAVQTLKSLPDNVGYIFSDAFDGSLAEQASNLSRSAGGEVIGPASLLKSVFKNGDWGSTADDARKRILHTASNWIDFVSNGGDNGASDGKMTFTVSSVPVIGLEGNGYVAGFNLKF